MRLPFSYPSQEPVFIAWTTILALEIYLAGLEITVEGEKRFIDRQRMRRDINSVKSFIQEHGYLRIQKVGNVKVA